jgi:hypothetical protein
MKWPPLWKTFGHYSHYALTGYIIGGFCAILTWAIIQFLAVSDATPLTPAATAFFAGITLIMLLIVAGFFVTVIAVQNAIIDALYIPQEDEVKD